MRSVVLDAMARQDNADAERLETYMRAIRSRVDVGAWARFLNRPIEVSRPQIRRAAHAPGEAGVPAGQMGMSAAALATHLKSPSQLIEDELVRLNDASEYDPVAALGRWQLLELGRSPAARQSAKFQPFVKQARPYTTLSSARRPLPAVPIPALQQRVLAAPPVLAFITPDASPREGDDEPSSARQSRADLTNFDRKHAESWRSTTPRRLWSGSEQRTPPSPQSPFSGVSGGGFSGRSY